MKVRDLIEALSRFDPDDEVKIPAGDRDRPPYSVVRVRRGSYQDGHSGEDLYVALDRR